MNQEYWGNNEALPKTTGNHMIDEIWKTYDDLLPYEVKSQHCGEECLQLQKLVKIEQPCPIKAHTSEVQNLPAAFCQPSTAIPYHSPISSIPVPACGGLNDDMCEALVSAPRQPPVTVASLAQLDISCIFNNIHIRSGVNFETDLHFMPIKGCLAEQRQKMAQRYWLALAAEFQAHAHSQKICCADNEKSDVVNTTFTPRLPQLFVDLRELLQMLVPIYEHANIHENLDVSFLMQQIKNGVLDIIRLSSWLALMLKKYCAPMRDLWADQMLVQMKSAASKCNTVMLVKGIEKLFSVLEAMRLVSADAGGAKCCIGGLMRGQDVANHQIRTFRFLLLEDTIAFQQKFFHQKFVEGAIEFKICREWFKEVMDDHRSSAHWTQNDDPKTVKYGAFITGVLSTLLTASGQAKLPPSFNLDLRRLECIKHDIEDLFYLRTALAVFDELCLQLKADTPSHALDEVHSDISKRVMAIIEGQPPGADMDVLSGSLTDVSVEITRAACTHLQVPESLVSDPLIQKTRFRLQKMHFGQTNESRCRWRSTLADLTSRATYHMNLFDKMAAPAISESQLHWRRRHQQGTADLPLPNIEDVARRLAHVVVIHWRVWATLAYLDQSAPSSSEMHHTLSLPSNLRAHNDTDAMPTRTRSHETLAERQRSTK